MVRARITRPGRDPRPRRGRGPRPHRALRRLPGQDQLAQRQDHRRLAARTLQRLHLPRPRGDADHRRHQRPDRAVGLPHHQRRQPLRRERAHRLGRADLAHARDRQATPSRPNEKWSNGTAFNGNDLVGWWLRARSAAHGALSDGYRDIKSLTVSKDGVRRDRRLRHPVRRLEPLFRDVEALGTQGNCSLSSLARASVAGAVLGHQRDGQSHRADHEPALAGRHRPLRAHRHHRRRGDPGLAERALRRTSRSSSIARWSRPSARAPT